MRFISRSLIILGLLSIISSSLLIWERNNPKRLTFNSYTSTNFTNYNDYPVEIQIKSVHLNLPIVQSQIHNNSWETTTDGVSYLISSPIPGKTGNSILYGHNWNNLLGPLNKVKTGDEIAIRYKTGKIKTFKVNAIGVVTPDQTHILSSTNDARITLFTCTGFLDSKRLVVTAISADNPVHKGLTERRVQL